MTVISKMKKMDEFNFSVTIKKAKTRKKKYFGTLREVFDEIKKSTPFRSKDTCFIHDLRLNLSSYVRFKPKGMVFYTRPLNVNNKYHPPRNRDYYQRRNNLIKRLFFNFILPPGPNHPVIKLKTIQE